MRGRPPKPTRLKILNGTLRSDRINENEPQPGSLPKCPKTLPKRAKAVWRDLCRQLIESRMITGIDSMVLGALCVAWTEFEAAVETIEREGRVQENQYGKRSHPAVKHMNEAMVQIRQYSGLLGLDPSSRSRLHITPVQKQGIAVRDRSKAPKAVGDA